MKGQRFQRLLPTEFDAALLKKLTSEGRVYVDCPRVTDRDAYRREALEYVRSIEDFATDLWRKDIGRLWARIVETPCFEPCLSMKKGPQAGHLNRYAMTNLVCRLQNLGVYRRDVPMLTLHLALEHSSRRNKYYCSCGNYCLSIEARNSLRELLRRV